jgi:hypothetical protein
MGHTKGRRVQAIAYTGGEILMDEMTTMHTIEQIIARWNSGKGKPYKGNLIDWDAYNGDGTTTPDDIGCMCAQGQVLHLLGGWSPDRLRNAAQRDADRETAELLGISVAHAILLRRINDSVDGAPAIVLSDPGKILGDRAETVLAFWRHIDRMTGLDWQAVSTAAARGVSGGVAGVAARVAAGVAAGVAARVAAGDAAWVAARDAARDAAGDAAWDAAWDAAGASNEIQGAAIMKERGHPFVFLPMFGFETPDDVLKGGR